MLVIEGVYSMEGHICRLPELTEIADENACFTVLDDAHGLGVLGRQGRGTVDHFGLNDSVDVICGSLSKSLASTGGFVAASTEVIEFLRTSTRSRPSSARRSAPARPPSPRPSARHHADRAGAPGEALVQHQRSTGPCSRASASTRGRAETPAVPIVLGSKERVYPFFWKAFLLGRRGSFTVMATSPCGSRRQGPDSHRSLRPCTPTSSFLRRSPRPWPTRPRSFRAPLGAARGRGRP